MRSMLIGFLACELDTANNDFFLSLNRVKIAKTYICKKQVQQKS